MSVCQELAVNLSKSSSLLGPSEAGSPRIVNQSWAVQAFGLVVDGWRVDLVNQVGDVQAASSRDPTTAPFPTSLTPSSQQ